MAKFLIEFEHAFTDDFRETIEADNHKEAFEKVFKEWEVHPNELYSNVRVTELGEKQTFSQEEAQEALVNPDFWDGF